jgi:hypothetical protein
MSSFSGEAMIFESFLCEELLLGRVYACENFGSFNAVFGAYAFRPHPTLAKGSPNG